MQLILLAAGRGNRLPKRFRNQPKCMTLIRNRSILDHNVNFYKKFNNKIIVAGYKNEKIKAFAKKFDFKIVKNTKFRSTNMVYSLFLSSKFIKQDVVICYGDIIFDGNIYKKLNLKGNLIPLNLNWLNLWKKRMSTKMIRKDAENLTIKNGYLDSIGGKITKNYPTSQYMGLLKLEKKSFFTMKSFFNKLHNKKIDMTTFINKVIKIKKIKIKTIKYKKFWFEIDSHKDINVANSLINKW
jgi:choline kinase